MYAINTYKDLCIEIEISQININRLKNEKKIWEDCLKAPGDVKAQAYSDMPKGSINFTTLERVIPNINVIDIKLEREELILKGMLDQKELMNVKLKGLTGLQYKVIKLKEVDDLNFIQISQRVNCSERTVHRIIAIVKKNRKENKII